MDARAKFEIVQMLLTAPTFTNRMDPHVRPATGDREAEQGGTIIWDGVKEEAQRCSRGERVIVEIAWGLWSGQQTALTFPGTGPTFADLYSIDAEHVMLVSLALQVAAVGMS